MFKFSAKQKAAIKLWFHGAIIVEIAAFTNFFSTFHGHFTMAGFLKSVIAAVSVPVTTWLARLYSFAALKYPMLKPIALWVAKRASKKLALGVPTPK